MSALLAWPRVMTTTAWLAPAPVVRAAAVHVMLVAETTVRPEQAAPPTVTVVAPLRVLKPEPLMVMDPPAMERPEGVTLVRVAAPAPISACHEVLATCTLTGTANSRQLQVKHPPR